MLLTTFERQKTSTTLSGWNVKHFFFRLSSHGATKSWEFCMDGLIHSFHWMALEQTYEFHIIIHIQSCIVSHIGENGWINSCTLLVGKCIVYWNCRIHQNQNIKQTFHKKTNRIKHFATINNLKELFCPTKKQTDIFSNQKKNPIHKLKNTYFCPPLPKKSSHCERALVPRFRVLPRCHEASIDGTWLSQLKPRRDCWWRLKKNWWPWREGNQFKKDGWSLVFEFFFETKDFLCFLWK